MLIEQAIARLMAESTQCSIRNRYVILRDGIYEFEIRVRGEKIIAVISGPILNADTAEHLIVQQKILSRSQARVAVLIATGQTNENIANVLGISPHTARRHTETLFAKLQVADRTAVNAALITRLFGDCPISTGS